MQQKIHRQLLEALRVNYSSRGKRAIRNLLSIQWSGTDNEFWRQQIELLCDTYNLDDNAIKALISSKLKGKALSLVSFEIWTYSGKRDGSLDGVKKYPTVQG